MRDIDFWFYRLLIQDLCSDACERYGDLYFEAMRIESREGREGVYVETQQGGKMFWTLNQLTNYYKEKNNERLRIRRGME